MSIVSAIGVTADQLKLAHTRYRKPGVAQGLTLASHKLIFAVLRDLTSDLAVAYDGARLALTGHQEAAARMKRAANLIDQGAGAADHVARLLSLAVGQLPEGSAESAPFPGHPILTALDDARSAIGQVTDQAWHYSQPGEVSPILQRLHAAAVALHHVQTLAGQTAGLACKRAFPARRAGRHTGLQVELTEQMSGAAKATALAARFTAQVELTEQMHPLTAAR